MDIFNIKLEFVHERFREVIEQCAKKKGRGYVCVVDANVVTMAQKDEIYRKVIYNSLINTCDGGSLATIANRIYGTNYTAFNGPDVFAEYIERTDIKQLLLGNTEAKYNRVLDKLKENGKSVDHLSYMPLPYATIDEFDYEGVAKAINDIQPDFIWVSLGAPKQELFMSRILPYLDSGLMFGIGAAFSFYVGDIIQPKFHIGSFRFTWLDRIIKEPKKQLKRVFKIVLAYPSLYIRERQRAKNIIV